MTLLCLHQRLLDLECYAMSSHSKLFRGCHCQRAFDEKLCVNISATVQLHLLSAGISHKEAGDICVDILIRL